MSDAQKELQKLVETLPFQRWKFEAAVECACLEITDIAKQISPAIGEISIDEAFDVIIKEFTERLKS